MNRYWAPFGEGDRVNLFDVRSNRTGSGRIEGGRRVDFFDTRGNCPGTAIVQGDRAGPRRYASRGRRTFSLVS